MPCGCDLYRVTIRYRKCLYERWGRKILNIEHLKKLVDTNETDFHNFKLGEGICDLCVPHQCPRGFDITYLPAR